jgi:hypothetical protein
MVTMFSLVNLMTADPGPARDNPCAVRADARFGPDGTSRPTMTDSTAFFQSA